MQTTTEITSRKNAAAVRLNRMSYWVSRNWMILFSVFYGLYVGLPFLAPVFMAAGFTGPARVIYFIYSYLCHQLPERSFFMFGPRIMVPLPDILATGQVTGDPLVLRQFIGSPVMGWKVAWSDRMVSMFTSVLIFSWFWYPLRKKLSAISWKVFVLFLLPMALDGTTHMISDVLGMHQGFRDTNAWLSALTNNAFAPSFYSGDAWGSFNSIMRLVSGVFFGMGIVWFGFPYFASFFEEQAEWIRQKFEKANLNLFEP